MFFVQIIFLILIILFFIQKKGGFKTLSITKKNRALYTEAQINNFHKRTLKARLDFPFRNEKCNLLGSVTAEFVSKQDENWVFDESEYYSTPPLPIINEYIADKKSKTHFWTSKLNIFVNPHDGRVKAESLMLNPIEARFFYSALLKALSEARKINDSSEKYILSQDIDCSGPYSISVMSENEDINIHILFWRMGKDSLFTAFDLDEATLLSTEVKKYFDVGFKLKNKLTQLNEVTKKPLNHNH